MIDTHAHLDACEGPIAAVLTRARDAGVTRVVTIGTGIDSCRRSLELAEVHEGVVAALGIDPHQASTTEAGRIDELRELLTHSKAVAVGETGLDNHHRLADPSDQRRVFEEQLALADELGLPVVVHSREADADTAAALAGFAGPVVLHCFSSPPLLDIALERGYFVSFAGNVTFPKAAELREAAAKVPLDRLLVETDSPYLAPQPVRGKRNEPAFVQHTLRTLAEVKDVDPAELESLVDANADAAFGLAVRMEPAAGGRP